MQGELPRGIVGQSHLDLNLALLEGLDDSLANQLLNPQHGRLLDVEEGPHRIDGADRGQERVVGPDQVSLGDKGPADAAADGSGDPGKLQVQLRRLDLGLGRLQVAHVLRLLGQVLIDVLLAGGRTQQQLAVTIHLDSQKLLLGFQAFHLPLGLIQGGLERAGIDLVEQVALLDDVAVSEVDFDQVAADPPRMSTVLAASV